MHFCSFLTQKKYSLFLHIVYGWVACKVVKKGLRRDDGEGKHMLAFPPHFPESFVEKKRFTEPCAELGNSAIAEELGGKAEQKTEQTKKQ